MEKSGIKICYDISILGLTISDKKNRAGIFRVVENVLVELLKTKNVYMQLDCRQTESIICWCMEYIKLNQFSCDFYFMHNPILDSKLIDIDVVCKKIENKLKDIIYNNNNLNLPLTFLRRSVKKIRLTNNSLLNYQKYLLNIYKKINKKNPYEGCDIYHSPFFPIPESARCKKMIFFLTIHDLIPFIYPQYFEDGMDDFFKSLMSNVRKSDWIIAVSESTKNDLCEFRNDIDPNKVIVVPLAADRNIFYPCKESEILNEVRKRYKIPEGRYVLSVNTIEPRKNMEQVINSFFKLCQEERIDDLSLVLVGAKGWKYEGIFNLLSKHENLRHRVVITGYVPDEDLAALYSGAMVFVYPSFYEGFGLPPLEAMQCGVPVIVSNTSSLPEVVGDAGILVNPKDGDAICQGILDIYRGNDLRMQLAAKSLKNAERFSWKRCAEETVSAYRTSLSE